MTHNDSGPSASDLEDVGIIVEIPPHGEFGRARLPRNRTPAMQQYLL
jgi:hypothetical protein